jgi:hypothetical protein
VCELAQDVDENVITSIICVFKAPLNPQGGETAKVVLEAKKYFHRWNQQTLSSYLNTITSTILKKLIASLNNIVPKLNALPHILKFDPMRKISEWLFRATFMYSGFLHDELAVIVVIQNTRKTNINKYLSF